MPCRDISQASHYSKSQQASLLLQNECLSLQPTEEGQFSFFFFFCEYDFSGKMPKQTPRFSSKSLMHNNSENLQSYSFHLRGINTCIVLPETCM